MNPSRRELFWRLRSEFSGRPILSTIQLLCFVTWITTVFLGTYLHFSLSRLQLLPTAISQTLSSF